MEIHFCWGSTQLEKFSKRNCFLRRIVTWVSQNWLLRSVVSKDQAIRRKCHGSHSLELPPVEPVCRGQRPDRQSTGGAAGSDLVLPAATVCFY